MPQFEVRAALPDDEGALLDLARHLNTVNLPNDRAHIRALLQVSQQSFLGQLPPSHRKYVFVLWDNQQHCVVATSSLIAKLGHRGAPYIYFDVIPEEKYSKLLDRHFHHSLLRLGFSYDGPTELGGLVVVPSYRKHPERLGRFISFVRFLYIAAHPNLFEQELLAELLPPLESDGTSRLWEALGRRFTNMTYLEADLLSSQNKDFIRDLFPGSALYASVLSPEAQAVVGQVGDASRGVERMLTQVGFRYAERVDPFDGGPHFVARTNEVTAITQTQTLPYTGPCSGYNQTMLIARFSAAPPFAHAVRSVGQLAKAGVSLPDETASQLGLIAGDRVVCLPEKAAQP